jgi:hypothetical protein
MEQFLNNGPGRPRKRPSSVCLICRSKNLLWQEAHKQYDWAKALIKSTRMSLNHPTHEATNQPEMWTGQIQEVELRALMALQEGCCALD